MRRCSRLPRFFSEGASAAAHDAACGLWLAPVLPAPGDRSSPLTAGSLQPPPSGRCRSQPREAACAASGVWGLRGKAGLGIKLKSRQDLMAPTPRPRWDRLEEGAGPGAPCPTCKNGGRARYSATGEPTINSPIGHFIGAVNVCVSRALIIRGNGHVTRAYYTCVTPSHACSAAIIM